MIDMLFNYGGYALLLIPAVIAALVFATMRKVVPTNMVHIVQYRKTTVSYGSGKDAGNVYYKWPSWAPGLGVTVVKLPVSNFDLMLNDYDAYDMERVPFLVDVAAFFRISDTDKAAQRVEDFRELKRQLTLIVQGAVRKVLAGSDIDSIMTQRSTFGDSFSDEVASELAEWGVESVKSMELMDIRDEKKGGGTPIANIMQKRMSGIDRESRQEVAANRQAAELAEIAAQQAVDVRNQEAREAVGQRRAQQEKLVGLAEESQRQEVLEQQVITKEREMKVARVEQVEQARIDRDRQVVEAESDRQTLEIRADGDLAAKEREAKGIEALGQANAAAEKAMQLAPVEAKIVLAEKIQGNPRYQRFLMALDAITAYREVGQAQAGALQNAKVRVIANTGSPTAGMSNVMDLFTSSGGTNVAAAVEALAQSPLGAALLERFGIGGNERDSVVEEVESDELDEVEPNA
jgi:flotillin